jgi:hypothetical protein
LLVYDLDGDIAVHLNGTAALVWRSCDGRRAVAGLVRVVQNELDEAADEDVVLMALDTLSEHGLIRAGYEERDGAAVALSRRRFFRRVGVVGAAAVNAPVVYSALVPTAAAALSSGGHAGGSTQPVFSQPTPPSSQSSASGGSGNTGNSGNSGSSGAGNSGAGNSGGGNTGGGSSYP